ncbi:SDR family oxidoreductase [Actinoplanes sp. TBRC 11911]|uniref:SDR family oxidoreductase n=1 Tax=Actinoplanes sp. TBRC 11911 TaxID=2729386 RepID=UPI00145F9EB3|nr:SDR family oxidoreductase [Actinoplanes sp. TBRC 11911]NMO49935.1 SDR family oxidoreductase [Actinoplanes sp. TBRC 11911]
MDISNSVALVTGANRGLGRHFATQLLEHGAKVYAGVRNPRTLDLPGAVPIEIDITDPDAVERAAKAAGDVTLLVNNAGALHPASVLTASMDDVRREMEVNYFAPLTVIRAFAPVIEANGGGAILNALSVLAWYHAGALGAHNAAKAASWAATDALREELAPHGVAVTSLIMGWMFTDLAGFIPDDQKVDPAGVARVALDGVAAGLPEVLADATAQRVKSSLSA